MVHLTECIDAMRTLPKRRSVWRSILLNEVDACSLVMTSLFSQVMNGALSSLLAETAANLKTC